MNSNWMLILLAPSLVWMILVKACEHPSPEYPGAYPSYGDLRLCKSGLFMIYMGQEGTNIEHMWGTFGGAHIGQQDNVQNTLCQQFGYAEGNLSFRHSSNELQDYPVWISGVTCDSTYQHILRCNCTPTDSPNTARHTDDWHLTCFGEVRSGNAYHRQVALIPPTDVNYKFYTKSFGVVVFLKRKNEWKYIVEDSSFDFNIADTACRAMGFTHVVRNSVTTVQQYIEAYGRNDSFSASLNKASAGSVDCSGSLQCFGCCQLFNSPKVNSRAKDYNAMVVRCSFYEQTPNNPFASGGYKSICETASPNEGQVCEPEKIHSSPTFSDTTGKTLSAFLGFFGITTIALVILSITLGGCLYRRRGYNRLEGNNGGEGGGQGGGQGGNGDNGGNGGNGGGH